MGRVADALRANLRQLALSDARSLRELQAELGAGGKGGASATPRVLPGGGAVAGLPAGGGSGDGLDELGVTKLRALCRERGLKGYSRFTKAQCLALLRGERLPPVRPATPGPHTWSSDWTGWRPWWCW